MNGSVLKSLLAASVLTGLAGLAHADNAIYVCVDASGREQLSNSATEGQCKQLLSGPAAVAEPAPAMRAAPVLAQPAPAQAPAVAVQPAAGATQVARDDNAGADSLVAPPSPQPRNAGEARLAAVRDAAIQRTADAYASNEPATGINRAVNRKYLMMSRSAYLQAMGISY